MEFWGAEVEAGKPLVVRPDEDCLIHISQATLALKAKKGESGLLYVTVDGEKLVMGTLSQQTFPQINIDLVFDKEFELSHSLEKASVHFVGYKSPNIDEEEGDYCSGSESEEEDVPEVVPTAAASDVVKAGSKPAEVKPESAEEEDGSDSEKGKEVDSEEEIPKPLESSNKKRANESASETPVSTKKAKPASAAVTPQQPQSFFSNLWSRFRGL
ncbi:hypothetical protein AALP_AA6G337000 [Arabis alpina]|uniref:Nucleoplasmin-like domain-containing protein n=1 Tax=Arabis alpina TaxID=50452 RepID=A0A087GTE5_ARAAL|nr:hypothetical protein AALP_AA6G337000 [Arabis alpina]